ncbi:MAG TPA: penicillin-binding transpeptidase domain-containing protein [Tepidisphaeraceae bacterium]|nr:penicillin-binding transpeptidase domain-containing protein [Tepidisphaeraceae bacterium]
MFERRLKIFLGLLSLVVIVLLGRAAQLQVAQGDQWRKEASAALQRTTPIETTRGSILDRNGQKLARDRACTDACVLYYALTPQADPKWLGKYAANRLSGRLGDASSRMSLAGRTRMLKDESSAVQRDIDAMWDKLARLSGQSRDDIERIRQTVLQRVEMRKKYIWYQSYLRAIKTGTGGPDSEPRWERWLSGESDDAPEIDKFTVTVGEEQQPHVILHDITIDLQNELGRHPEQFPGLVLKPGLTRYYPYDDVACHVLGHVGKVKQEDLHNDANRDDPRRRYQLNDQIGRGGLEWLCEPALRGTLGLTTTIAGDDGPGNTEPPVPGQDVRCSIDIDVQRDIQNFFAHATLRSRDPQTHETIETKDQVLHGAAVLLDVKTNQVLALVSYPTYDLNTYDRDYQVLSDDQVNDPMRDRATESQLEPGSTVKPLVGLSAITAGVIKVNEGIECKGYLELPNHHGGVIRYGRVGRCWVASMYADLLHDNVAHHPVPVPHHGHDGNLDGFLTYSDGLERSCNVYFETAADRLGIDALSDWMRRFGLGRRTGIGIEEYEGRVPVDRRASFHMLERTTGFLGGIGQGNVAATPIQMANVAATIARNGIWMRPRLVMENEDGTMPKLHSARIEVPDQIDLHLDPEALKACKLGMLNVVNGVAGTGTAAHMDELLIAGKTGTAQASPFRVIERDPVTHAVLKDENDKPRYLTFDPSTPEHPNLQVPWYRGGGRNNAQIDHAWMIGFAPADNPKIAFGVLVEYGGSGGGAAADVVRAALESCIEHGYLKSRPAPATQPVAQATGEH